MIGLTCTLLHFSALYNFLFSNFVSGIVNCCDLAGQGFDSGYEYQTSTVLEHLESRGQDSANVLDWRQ